MNDMAGKAIPPVIVGAGPAGVRAAQTLVAHGLRPASNPESVGLLRPNCGGWRR